MSYMTLSKIKEYGEFPCNVSHLNRLCAKVNARPAQVYELIKDYGGLADTVTREAIFNYVSAKYKKDYDVVYSAWLGGAK